MILKFYQRWLRLFALFSNRPGLGDVGYMDFSTGDFFAVVECYFSTCWLSVKT